MDAVFSLVATNVFGTSLLVGDGSPGSLDGMLAIFTKVFAWILQEGAVLVTWMLDKPIILATMSLFFCGAIIAFVGRIFSMHP